VDFWIGAPLVVRRLKPLNAGAMIAVESLRALAVVARDAGDFE
jgi:hypothetical protein